VGALVVSVMTGVVVGEGMDVGSVVGVEGVVGVVPVHPVVKMNNVTTIRKNPNRCTIINL
jgi:hypothetical protein